MKIFGRGKKDDKEEQFATDMALTEHSRPMADEMINSLGRSVYMVMDPDVQAILNNPEKTNPQLQALLPAFSHLNRTTKIGKTQAELLTLDYEYLSLIHKLNMNEDEYENVGWALLESLKIFASGIISDALDGFKARVITEQIKIIRTELQKQKKKGIF